MDDRGDPALDPTPVHRNYVPAEALTANAAIMPAHKRTRGVSRERRYVPPKPTEPWERQPGEAPRMYRAFCMFRDAGEERQVSKTARSMHLVVRNVHAWATIWKWQERVAAWDQEIDRKASAAALRAATKMQERHINIAMKMQQAVAERLMEDEQPKLSNRDIDRWLEKAVRIERMARGINDGPRVAINVNQQQAQQSTTATVINDAQRTIAEMIASDPSILSLMNSEIDGLLGAVEEYSTGNEPAQVLSGE
jgi:hypothetical protein